MTSSFENKLKGMFWDMSPSFRNEIVGKILRDPADALRDEQVLIRVLSTLNWYELIHLTGSDGLLKLLDDTTINRLFPEGRRNFYINAKKLLSKYTLSTSG
jgi:hypothetical protein